MRRGGESKREERQDKVWQVIAELAWMGDQGLAWTRWTEGPVFMMYLSKNPEQLGTENIAPNIDFTTAGSLERVPLEKLTSHGDSVIGLILV